MGVEPLLGVDLVRAEHGPDLVVEDLRRGTRKGLEAGISQGGEVGGQRHPVPPRPFGDFQRGEAVDVDGVRRLPDGLDDLQVIVTVELRVDPALQADLGGPQFLGFADPVGDLAELEQVGGPAEVEGKWALGEGAEPALEGADVGVVDVPVGHEGHLVADDLRPQAIGDFGDGPDLGAAGGEQGHDLVLVDLPSRHHRGQHFPDRAAGRGERHGRRRRGHRTGEGAEELGRVDLAPGAPGMVPAQRLGVGGVEHREPHRLSQPAGGIEGEFGVDGQPRGQGVAVGFGGRPEDAESRPCPFRVHVVGGDRRHAPPVVDARRQQRGQVVGEVGRGLQVDLRREQQSGDGDGPEKLVGRARGSLVHGGARLGQEVLDDDLLDMAVAPMAPGDGLEGGDAILPRLPDADQEPGGEGNRCRPGGLQGGQPAGRGLVGGRAMGRQAGIHRLDHHALAGRHLSEPGELLAGQGAGVGVGEQPGLLEDGPAGGHQVVDGGREPMVGEPTPGIRVAVLGAFAEGEQRLVAARRPAGAGNLQHLVEGEVRGLDPGRGFGEGAVSAAVTTQHGERDEDLGGEGDPVAMGALADLPSPGLEYRQFGAKQIVRAGSRRVPDVRVRRRRAMVSGHRRHPIGAGHGPDPSEPQLDFG